MTLLLKQVFQFIKLLNSDTGTSQLASGVAVGVILGFTPALSLQTVLMIVLLFFLRIQLGAAMVTAFFFKFAAYLLDPVFDPVGRTVLEAQALRPLLTELYNMPLVPLTRFNNSIVMGSGVVALAAAPVVFVASKWLISAYRAKVVARFESTSLWKAVKATSMYKWYVKYDELFGGA